MKLETTQIEQMRQLMDRGAELTGQGCLRTGITIPHIEVGHQPIFYVNCLVLIRGQEYRISYERNRGEYNQDKDQWDIRKTLVVAFIPQTEDDLRFKEGNSSAESDWPFLTIFHEGDEYRGSLEFNRQDVERAHFWLRWKDWYEHPDNGIVTTIAGIVGEDKGVNRILNNLSRRVSVVPDSIVPINPGQWEDIALKHAGIVYVF